MTILVTGANGQLGNEMRMVAKNSKDSYIFTDVVDASEESIAMLRKLAGNDIKTDTFHLDITNLDDIRKIVKSEGVNAIVNCAAYTAVDAAEDDFGNAHKINVIGPYNLAQTNCNLIHISTDYVFDGNANRPYKPDDSTSPKSVYGLTKRTGEMAILNDSDHSIIIRTSWLFSPYGKNFVKTMRNLGVNKSEISVVADQFGKPTYAADLAGAIVQIIPQMTIKNAGVYHYSNACDVGHEISGISWCDFATEIMKQSKLNCDVKPITTDKYPTRAVRPKYSVLDTSKIQKVFGIKIPLWQNALERCIREIERQ